MPTSEMPANESSQNHFHSVTLLLSFFCLFIQTNPRQRDKVSSYMHPMFLDVVLVCLSDGTK